MELLYLLILIKDMYQWQMWRIEGAASLLRHLRRPTLTKSKGQSKCQGQSKKPLPGILEFEYGVESYDGLKSASIGACTALTTDFSSALAG